MTRRQIWRRLQVAFTVFCVFWALAFLAAGAIRAEGARVSVVGLVLLLIAVVNNSNMRRSSPKRTDYNGISPADAPYDH